jgi:hypothetical protein
MSPRHRALLAMLLVSAALVAYDQTRSEASTSANIVEAAPRHAGAPRTAPHAREQASTIGSVSPRDQFVADDQNAFEPLDPPAPPAPVAVPQKAPPPPPPTAPQLPFAAIGKKFQGGQWEVFLAHDDRTYLAHVDDVIDDTYRVVAINPPSMTLVYLPMNEQQTLDIGKALDE